MAISDNVSFWWIFLLFSLGCVLIIHMTGDFHLLDTKLFFLVKYTVIIITEIPNLFKKTGPATKSLANGQLRGTYNTGGH